MLSTTTLREKFQHPIAHNSTNCGVPSNHKTYAPFPNLIAKLYRNHNASVRTDITSKTFNILATWTRCFFSDIALKVCFFVMTFFIASLAFLCLASASDVVVVSGATGRTGSLIYKALQEQNFNVRSLVHNVTKARERLGCAACDASEGIFVGDVTDPSTLTAPMVGAGSFIIATGAPLVCPDDTNLTKCYYTSGDLPIDVDFNGGKNQLAAIAEATRGSGHVVLISSMGTTVPDSIETSSAMARSSSTS